MPTYQELFMRFIIFLLLIVNFQAVSAQPDTSQKIVSGRSNSPSHEQRPYIIIISVDGFRHDYAEKHGAVYLRQLGKAYTKADYMLPSYPSLTFPNHYTLVTGLYPSHHGLVDNSFYDRAFGEDYTMRKTDRVRSGKWYGGTPLWVLAEQNKMLSASFYWVGTEAAIQQTLPTYYYYYNEAIPVDKRIQTVVNWLQLPAEKRPHFISFYFPEVDHAGHTYGPDAPETGVAVRFIDSAIRRLTEAVSKTGLPVNYILVSDHGMTTVDTAHPLRVPAIDSSKAVVIGGGEQVHLYVKKKEDIQPLYKKLKEAAGKYNVMLRNKMPKRLHYGEKDDLFNRIGDIVLQSKWPYVFAAPGAKVKAGAHGFDATRVPDMRAVFYAWGPAFKENNRMKWIRNVDVYPIVTEILGLEFNHSIDGKLKAARRALK